MQKPTTSKPLALGIGFTIGAVHRELRARWATSLRPSGVTPPEAAAIRALEAHPNRSLRELARSLHSEPINLARSLDPLLERGLLVVNDDPGDRRKLRYNLTETGENLAVRIRASATRFEADIANIFGQDALDELDKQVSRLLTLLRSQTTQPKG
ncbi:MAG: MarR family winged helix-turn-helix transcriptional regulator [Ferrimicrobium sp.]